MTYTINDSAGNIVTTINDFEKEIIGGLSLLGYGYVNFGEEIANDFVALATNFQSPVAPVNPFNGQIWCDDSKPYWELKSWTGSKWIALLAIDIANSRALIYYNGSPIAPDINPTPTTLVVRGPDGLIPASSLPAPPSSVGHASNADHASSADTATNANHANNADNATNASNANHANNADSATYAGTAGHADNALRLDHYNVFGSRNGGIQYNGNNDVGLTTAHIAEGDQQYFTTARARAALSGAGAISYDQNSGVISYNPPAASAVVTHFNGRAGDVSLSGGDVTNALGFTPVQQGGGANQGNNKIYLGWTGSHLSLQVDNNSGFGIVWCQGYQGSGSGMDADMVDGYHADQLVKVGDLDNISGGFWNSPGNYTATAPDWARRCEFVVVGGGGGGGGSNGSLSGGGGGSGGTVWGQINVSSGQQIGVTVGAGGAGSTAVSSTNTSTGKGTAGGTSAFGPYQAGGGDGAYANLGTTAGGGGAGTANTGGQVWGWQGGCGGDGNTGSNKYQGGHGGNGFFGGAGRTGAGGGVQGSDGTGGGGGGAWAGSGTGGRGGHGSVSIRWYP